MTEKEPMTKKDRRFKVSAEEIAEALYARGGNMRQAAAWLKEKKGITVSDRAISKRVRGSLRLKNVLADAEEREASRRKKCLALEAGITGGPKECAPLPGVSDTLLKEALIRNCGIYPDVIKYLNEFHGITMTEEDLCRRIKRSPELRAARNEGRSAIRDLAEEHLMDLVRQGNPRSVIYCLVRTGAGEDLT